MWKLLFFVLMNGQPQLGLLDVYDKDDCHKTAVLMIKEAERQGLTMALKCVEIKIA